MRILITGGAGFVGSNLAIALNGRWPDAKVVCLDNLYRRGSELNVDRLQRNGITFVRGDVRDPSSLPVVPFDFVIECSAEPSVLAGQNESPDYLFHTNLIGAYHCLEKAREWGAGVIFFSTSRVYPIGRLEAHPWYETPTRFCWENVGRDRITSLGVSEEIDMRGARSLYGFTKLAAEQLIEEYRSSYGLRAVINRCGVIAGPWQFGKVDQGVAALWVMAHHFRRSLSYIGYGGTGKQVRDLLHVSDLCDLVTEQIDNFTAWDGWVGNVGGGAPNSVSLQELTRCCEEVTGRTITIGANSVTRKCDLRLFIGDTSRLLSHTTWRPRRSVRQIITDIHLWVRENEYPLEQLLAG